MLTFSKLTPDLTNAQPEKGYLKLSPEWLKANPTFELDIPLKPRFISPHPYTNQNIIAIARGPLVYCLEDIDNPWVNDHFKSLIFDPACAISESIASMPQTGEPYVSLTAHNAAAILSVDGSLAPHMPLGSITLQSNTIIHLFHFIPYALRDNRGGKGHMRVGIRRN